MFRSTTIYIIFNNNIEIILYQLIVDYTIDKQGQLLLM